MLAALSLKQSWIYKKIQVLAIFDDLDTILLMIPLQILMIGLRWQMFAIIAIVVVLLATGWRWQARWNVRQDWKTILGLVAGSRPDAGGSSPRRSLYGPEKQHPYRSAAPGSFVVGGMLRKHCHIDTPTEQRVSTGISFLFMLLVGLSMPLVTGAPADTTAAASVTGSQPMMPPRQRETSTSTVSVLSNLGKPAALPPRPRSSPPSAWRLPIGHVHPRRGAQAWPPHRLDTASAARRSSSRCSRWY